jgi:hypothetical protein
MKIGPDKAPTAEAQKRLNEELKKIGHGHDAMLSCYGDADAEKINKFAEKKAKDSSRLKYSWLRSRVA